MSQKSSLVEYPPLSETAEKLCDMVARGYSTQDAGKLLNLSEATAKEYRRRGRSRIRDIAIERLSEATPVAVGKLVDLLNADSEAVRLNAINRVLAADGLDVVQKHEYRDMTDASLNSALLSLFGGDIAKVSQVLVLLQTQEKVVSSTLTSAALTGVAFADEALVDATLVAGGTD